MTSGFCICWWWQSVSMQWRGIRIACCVLLISLRWLIFQASEDMTSVTFYSAPRYVTHMCQCLTSFTIREHFCQWVSTACHMVQYYLKPRSLHIIHMSDHVCNFLTVRQFLSLSHLVSCRSKNRLTSSFKFSSLHVIYSGNLMCAPPPTLLNDCSGLSPSTVQLQ